MNDIEFVVHGAIRACPLDVWDLLIGPKPGDRYWTDGCSFSPDWIATRYVWPACVIHDFHYSTGAVSRWRADWIFFRNLYRLLRAGGVFFGMALAFALIYWIAVRTRARGAYSG